MYSYNGSDRARVINCYKGEKKPKKAVRKVAMEYISYNDRSDL